MSAITAALSTIALLLVSGCAGGAQMRATGWVEVRTAGVRLRTDVGRERAIEIAEDFQDYRDALAGTFFQCAERAHGEPLSVTVLENDADFDAVAPRTANGVFVHHPRSWLGDEDHIILRNRRGPDARKLVVHELTHRLLAVCFTTAPTWMHEGFAAVFETARLDDGVLYVGLPAYAPTDDGAFGIRYVRGVNVMILPRSLFASVDALRQMDASTFHEAEGGMEPDAIERRVGHYAGAWALVHTLALGPPMLHDRFERYQVALSSGRTSEPDAWSEAFDGVDVQSHVDAFLGRRDIGYYEMPFRQLRHGRVQSVAMSESEAHLHWAGIHPWDDPAKRRSAREHVRLALALDAEHALPHLVDAAIAAAAGDADTARDAIATAHRLEPDSPEALHAAATMALSSEPVDGAALAPLSEALARVADTAGQLDMVARLAFAMADPQSAMTWARRALSTDPGCWPCRLTYARALAACGEPVAAERMLTTALNLAPDGARAELADAQRLLRELESRTPPSR